MSGVLRVAHLVPRTGVEGPFERFALWLQGCSIRCPGCCNPELFSSAGGRELAVEGLVAQVREAGVEGLTVLGGEPLEQLEPLAELCGRVRAAGLGVIVFTGFTFAQARARPGFSRLWAAIDTLVDGPFDARDRERGPGARRFIGSRNQGLRHRSERYAEPDLWRGENGAELRIEADGRISVHGFPDQAAALRRRLVSLASRRRDS